MNVKSSVIEIYVLSYDNYDTDGCLVCQGVVLKGMAIE